jgi:hypothetical protein
MRYRTHALILAAFAVTLGGLAAQTQKSGVGKVEAAAAPTAATSAPDAQRTRADLSALMRRFPPSVGAVLAMDHSLLGNSTYLEPYPALVAFLNEHPEVIHNPSFFFGDGMSYNRTMDPAERAANAQKDVMGGLAAITAFGLAIGLFVWLIRTFAEHKRWNRQARVQTEFHTKLLDRFSAHEDLLAYLQSPAGAKFLSATPIALDSPRTLGSPLGRIMWSAQAGVVLVAAGVGLYFAFGNSPDNGYQPMHALGVLAIALGIGFLISAILSYGISRRLKLIEPTPGA